MEVTTTRKKTIKNNDTFYGYVPPQSATLEKAIIGACMVEPKSFYTISDFLLPEMFYVDAHQRIFSSFFRLAKKGSPIDVLTVVEELKNNEDLDMVGGPHALTQLCSGIYSGSHIFGHAQIIKVKFVQRELIRISQETISLSFEDQDKESVNGILENGITSFYNLTKGFYKKDFTTPSENAKEIFEVIHNRMNREPGTITGKPSGFKAVDNVTHGWQDTDLIIIAARPAVGKTALALNIGFNLAQMLISSIAIEQKKGSAVAFFSLEMSTPQLVQRIVSTISEIELDKIISGNLNKFEYDRVLAAIRTFEKVQFFIDDTASLNPVEFKSKARRLVEKFNVGLIVVDYLQLMSPLTASVGKNKNDQIGEISRDLKITAKELKIPIIALSQLSRAVETRDKGQKSPNLGDLRDSGAIEQDADVVIFLYMDGTTAKLKIAKHRNGSLATIVLERKLEIQKFICKEAEAWTPKKADTGNFDDAADDVNPEYSFTN